MRKKSKLPLYIVIYPLVFLALNLFTQCQSKRHLTVWHGLRFLKETNLNTGGGAAPSRPPKPVHKRKP